MEAKTLYLCVTVGCSSVADHFSRMHIAPESNPSTKKNRNKRSIVAILMAAVVTSVSLVGCKGESDNTVVIQEGETPAGCIPDSPGLPSDFRGD